MPVKRCEHCNKFLPKKGLCQCWKIRAYDYLVNLDPVEIHNIYFFQRVTNKPVDHIVQHLSGIKKHVGVPYNIDLYLRSLSQKSVPMHKTRLSERLSLTG